MKIRKLKSKYGISVTLIILLAGILSCGERDALERIKESGKITVLIRNNAHSYYTYRGKPMGFEYDLAKAFSEYLGVKLEIQTPKWEGLIDALNDGKGDFVAASLTITPSRMKEVDFSTPYLSIQQQVILHNSNNGIRSIDDLKEKTVHLRRGTSYEKRLDELNQEGFQIKVRLYDDTPTEELIRMVSEREIDITIADSNVAILNRRYYPEIKLAYALGEPQSLGWAVKKGERKLRRKINAFFRKIKKDGNFNRIYSKYYSHVEIFDYFDLKKYHQRLETRLPRYKGIIQKAAEKHGFDWRLIAAMIYQESHFDPQATSFTGVKGIMQLTKVTAMELGIKNRHDPVQNIMGGVKYLRNLYNRFEDSQDPDRLLISLASYNVGRGHVLDAQSIAKERQMNPNSWPDLERILPLLRNPEYYKKTKYGYCRGTEPVRYVKRILTYYDILKMGAVR
ncbi:membrane-bound lytic murein transglycosylase MltF [Thermodesulfobacteriota bacterium]